MAMLTNPPEPHSCAGTEKAGDDAEEWDYEPKQRYCRGWCRVCLGLAQTEGNRQQEVELRGSHPGGCEQILLPLAACTSLNSLHCMSPATIPDQPS